MSSMALRTVDPFGRASGRFDSARFQQA